MNTVSWLETNVRKLKSAKVANARLDCLLLLEDVLGKDRTHLLAHPEIVLSSEQEKVLNSQVERRAKHEPIAYIRGKSEFYGREFLVNEHTLEPRPETETLIEVFKTSIKEHENFTVADIGTGSGCVAITTNLEIPAAKVYATDIDENCIKTTRRNAEKLNAQIVVKKGNLLEPLEKISLDALLCNLPYVPNKYELNKAAAFEPKHAIFGGTDGLDYYRRLFAQIENRKQKPSYVFTESLPFQHQALAIIADASGYRLDGTDDFIQVFVFQG